MCVDIVEGRRCAYGDRCKFAHHESEVRGARYFSRSRSHGSYRSRSRSRSPKKRHHRSRSKRERSRTRSPSSYSESEEEVPDARYPSPLNLAAKRTSAFNGTNAGAGLFAGTGMSLKKQLEFITNQLYIKLMEQNAKMKKDATRCTYCKMRQRLGPKCGLCRYCYQCLMS